MCVNKEFNHGRCYLEIWRVKQQGQRSVLGSVYVFCKCKDIDLRDRGLELKGEGFEFKELFADGSKEGVREQLGIGNVSGVRTEGSVRGNWPRGQRLGAEMGKVRVFMGWCEKELKISDSGRGELSFGW